MYEFKVNAELIEDRANELLQEGGSSEEPPRYIAKVRRTPLAGKEIIEIRDTHQNSFNGETIAAIKRIVWGILPGNEGNVLVYTKRPDIITEEELWNLADCKQYLSPTLRKKSTHLMSLM